MTATGEYYKDKVAIVTGAASRVGLALAETMLAYGARKVVLADFNDENIERETARLDAAYPGKTRGLHCNVTNEIEVRAMIRGAAEFGGRIDILFNNAGAGFGALFDKLTNKHWEKAFALNFYGALYGNPRRPANHAPAWRRAYRRHRFRHRVRAHGTDDAALRHEGCAERADARPPLRALGREHRRVVGDAGRDGDRDLEGKRRAAASTRAIG